MREWLSMNLVVGTLLVTSLTCIGALALWAATSPRHWFIRVAVVAIVLAPLLLIPAYEPLVTFATQCAVVAAGVTIYRWRQPRRAHTHPPETPDSEQRPPASRLRFSLSTLLLTMVLLAIVTPIAIKLPELNFAAWRSVVLVGVICGLATLVSAWMITSKRKLLAWPIGLLLCLLLGLLLCCGDWFATSLVKHLDWPPTGVARYDLRGNEREPLFKIWLFCVPAVALLLNFIALLWLVPIAALSRNVSRGFAVLILVLLAAFPLTIYWQLLHPLPMPHLTMPSPNGADDIAAAGRAFNTSPILNTNVEPNSTADLAAEVAKYANSYSQLRLGLSREVAIRPWPNDLLGSLTLAFGEISDMRSASRGLMREAELAQQQRRYKDAAEISLENIHLVQSIVRNGVIIDFLVGVAIEGIGNYSLYPALQKLSPEESRDIAAKIARIEKNREPIEDVLLRDRIWSEHAYGWWGHLIVLLDDIVDQSSNEAMVRAALARTNVVTRLMSVELAVREYQRKQGHLPESLSLLVPEYLPKLPADPFDPGGGTFHYIPDHNSFMVYSVGFDGRDNGGQPPSPKNLPSWDESTPADLRLDALFAPDETSPTPVPPATKN